MRKSPHDTVVIILLAIFAFLQPSGRAADSEVSPETPALQLVQSDIIEIKVFQEPDLDSVARVAEDGKITLPLIGEVAVAGKTVQQTARAIRDALNARFLVDPQVSVRLVEPAKRLFTVLGQVQRPGTYRFPGREPLNLIQVIGIAGGYTRLADPVRIIVKRRQNGKETVFELDAKRMARERGTAAFDVQAGDMITVSERLF